MTKIRNIKADIQTKMRKAYWQYVEDIITPIQDENEYSGMKRFWSFMKHMRKDYVGVSPLEEHGTTHVDAVSKANILNRQFQSVFTREEEIGPNLLSEHSNTTTMPEITITEQGVLKILQGLKHPQGYWS